MLCLLFILLFFREDSKRITWYERGEGCGVIIICFKIDLLNFSHYLWSPFLFAPNRYDCYYIISISIITTIVMMIIFYTHNQYNYLITYYSFKCYLLAESYFVSLIMLPCSNFFFVSHSLPLFLFWFLISTSLVMGVGCIFFISRL